MLRIRHLATLAALAVSLPSAGEEADDRLPPVQELDFEIQTVKAGLTGPAMKAVVEPPTPRFPPFIRVRRAFSEEVQQSVDDVK